MSTDRNHVTMPLSGKWDDIRVKVAIYLAKHVNWRTKKLERKAYGRIAEELSAFGVSPFYVGTIWRKHNQDILDTVNRDLVRSLNSLPRSGRPRKISVAELYEKVKAVPFHSYHKNVRILAFKIGIPKTTIQDALKKCLLKHTHNTIRPILTDKNKGDRVGYAVALYRTVSLLTCWREWILMRSGFTQQKLRQATSWSLGRPHLRLGLILGGALWTLLVLNLR